MSKSEKNKNNSSNSNDDKGIDRCIGTDQPEVTNGWDGKEFLNLCELAETISTRYLVLISYEILRDYLEE